MSVSTVPVKTRLLLWGKAGGRCQYEGCNKPLFEDSVTTAEFNSAYVAHIVADKPNGPRGDKVLSDRLKADIDNLMLLCDPHHRLVDKEDVDGHPVQRLIDMKRLHEERVFLATDVTAEKRSWAVVYGANIGLQPGTISRREVATAMFPKRYPAARDTIELGFVNSSTKDDDPEFWLRESRNLNTTFSARVREKLESGTINHLSVFALAPQPLLVQLGGLIGDKVPADVYQLHREPAGSWAWQDDGGSFEFLVERPEEKNGPPALNLSLSASISAARIEEAMGGSATHWIVRSPKPSTDFLKSERQLHAFRILMRALLEDIKEFHGASETIHVFPAAPVSAAIELGRAMMHKVHLPLRVYDQNVLSGGFKPALDVNPGERP